MDTVTQIISIPYMKAVDAQCHFSQCVQAMACTHASNEHVHAVLVTLLVLKMLCA